MSSLTRIPSSTSELVLAAVMAKSGKQITEGLDWHIIASNGSVLKSQAKTPHLDIAPGIYTIKLHYKQYQISLKAIQVRPHQMTNLLVRVGLPEPDGFYEDIDFSIEYERRKADRRAHNVAHDDILKQQIDAAQQQQQQQALEASHLGPQSHPLLSHQVQFDGAVEPEVNPLPDQNRDTVNELYHQYELELGYQAKPSFNPRPGQVP